MAPHPKQILAELVAIDSTSIRTNLPIIEAISARLTALGYRLERRPYRDEAGVEKVNLLALSAETRDPALVLVGHTDVVPFDPAWKEALTLQERDGLLYGRGACDTKGFVACALAAVARVPRTELRKPLALLFTADEEIGCLGAGHFAEQKPIAPRFAIVGEPTGLRPVRAHKGYCTAELSVTGREGHSAYPKSGASSILAASELIGRIEAIGRELEKDARPDFDPPYTTFNVGTIAGGSATNVIAGSCRFMLEWRPVAGQPPARMLEAVQAAAKEVGGRRGVEVAVRPIRRDASLDTRADSQLVRFLEERSGQPSMTVSYATEAPALASLGAEAVVFGPGDIKHAHRTGEHVPLAELERCTTILESAIGRFCG